VLPLPKPENSPFSASTFALTRPVARPTFASTKPFAKPIGADRMANFEANKFCFNLILFFTRPLISGSCGFGSFGS